MAKRRRPLEFTLLEDSKDFAKGSSAVGRKYRVNRRTGKTTAKGWGANLKVKDVYRVAIDARDLSRMVGNKVLPIQKEAFARNVNPANGGSLAPELQKRIQQGWRGIMGKAGKASRGGSWARGRDYLLSNLRRTNVGDTGTKGGRYRGSKRCAMKVYFSPGGRLNAKTSSTDSSGSRTFPNPAAAFNKLWQIKGQEQLSLAGKVEQAMQEGIEEWQEMVLDGAILPTVDSPDEAFGRKPGPKPVKV